jgi:hypothetical protein
MPSFKSALIVASAAYQDPGLRQLVAPTHDALALAEILGDPGVGGFDVKTVVDRPSYEVRAAIEELFADRKHDDVVLLYFSGHGVKDEDGQLYFTTIDTQLPRGRLRRATAVEDRFVNDAMRRCFSRRQVLLLDCCYSGAFAEGMLAKGGGAVDTKDRFDGRGRIVLTASDAMQYSFEADEIKGKGVRSYFTSALVQGLATGEADLDRDGHFSLDELYEYVHDRLADEVPQQRPMKMGFVEGKFFLAQNPRVKPAELPAELAQAIASGFKATRLGAVAELELLCKGSNRPLAEAARRALQAMADDDSREVARAAGAALNPGGEAASPAGAALLPGGEGVQAAAATLKPSGEAVQPVGAALNANGDAARTAAVVQGPGSKPLPVPEPASARTATAVPAPPAAATVRPSAPVAPAGRAVPSAPAPASFAAPVAAGPGAAAPVSPHAPGPAVTFSPAQRSPAPGPSAPTGSPAPSVRNAGARRPRRALLLLGVVAAVVLAAVAAFVIGAIVVASQRIATKPEDGGSKEIAAPAKPESDGQQFTPTPSKSKADSQEAAPTPSKVEAGGETVPATPEAVVQAFLAAAASGDSARAYGYYAAVNRRNQNLAQFDDITRTYADRFRAKMHLLRSGEVPGAVRLSGYCTLESGAVMLAYFNVLQENGEWRIGPWQIGSN